MRCKRGAIERLQGRADTGDEPAARLLAERSDIEGLRVEVLRGSARRRVLARCRPIQA